jgi:hypothetical protein
VRDKALETGAGAVDTARTLGTETLDRARSATDKLTIELAEQALRRRAEEEARKEREAIEVPKEQKA